jgi:hypothetical protein
MMTSLNRGDNSSVGIEGLFNQSLGSYATDPESTHFESSSLVAFF